MQRKAVFFHHSSSGLRFEVRLGNRHFEMQRSLSYTSQCKMCSIPKDLHNWFSSKCHRASSTRGNDPKMHILEQLITVIHLMTVKPKRGNAKFNMNSFTRINGTVLTLQATNQDEPNMSSIFQKPHDLHNNGINTINCCAMRKHVDMCHKLF